MVFDALNPFAAKNITNIGGTGASYKWGLGDPQDIKKLEPKLNLIKEFRTSELVAYSRLPLAMHAIVRVMDTIPTLRRMNRVLLYRF
ncbi:hypothetical protein MSHOH_0914 [Methanosarcina horonobensis HB-1 = JCM 15518]|uniref:Uncharacterized protein n=1 Tax=Methanosarcina horonobensis HB-1 = JCM 15518 TaxID=1434110 RepID=A0A0E3SBZ9_9EURY|nr:hypothetical protein [Methanosarcina horonobensis]AKB77397.1 hypothetical protein MSHOH_0914 [Methanosarcina horonobensis HB-1 = JCM 15518]